MAFKGGREASASIRALFDILKGAAVGAGVPGDAFVLLETRSDINAILDLDRYIDLLIPRGSNEFVRYIQDNTRIPVLGHAAGICHVYVDSEADLDMAVSVALDSKVQYPAVCNAAETILVSSAVADSFVPAWYQSMQLMEWRSAETRRCSPCAPDPPYPRRIPIGTPSTGTSSSP